MARRPYRASFDVSGDREPRPREVFVLRPVRDPKSGILRSSAVEEPTCRRGEGGAHGQGQPIERLCEMLARFLGRPVVDETGLDGVYDWDLPFRDGEPEVVMEALRKRLGLELVPDLRRVPFLVVVERDEIS